MLTDVSQAGASLQDGALDGLIILHVPLLHLSHTERLVAIPTDGPVGIAAALMHGSVDAALVGVPVGGVERGLARVADELTDAHWRPFLQHDRPQPAVEGVLLMVGSLLLLLNVPRALDEFAHVERVLRGAFSVLLEVHGRVR